jgi:hypothetical protein
MPLGKGLAKSNSPGISELRTDEDMGLFIHPNRVAVLLPQLNQNTIYTVSLWYCDEKGGRAVFSGIQI